MKPTLISHFYNEEFLLPFWIKHHKKLFGDAIMIDYKSTDNSVAIIKELAPDWKIITTRNEYFNGADIDSEVMDIESTVSGWKVCLNTTEFLLCPNLEDYLNDFEIQYPNLGVRTTAIYMVDPPELENENVDTNKLLISQKHWGYFEDEQSSPMIWCPTTNHTVRPPRKSRLIHNKSHGAYQVGRHDTNHSCHKDPNLYLCWFNWSPYKYISKRKINIYNKTSPNEQRQGLGLWLINDEETFLKQSRFHALRAENLMERQSYREAVRLFEESNK